MELAEKLPEVQNYPDTVRGMTVKDQDSFAQAGEAIKQLKNLEAQVVAFYSPMKEAAHKAHKAITQKEKEALGPVQEVTSLIRNRMNGYLAEEERKRQEIERRLRAEEEERARKERERIEAQAKKAEAAGKTEKAETLMEKAENVYAAPVSVASTVASVKTASGASVNMVDKLDVQVVDVKAFLRGLVEQNMAPTMIEVLQAKLVQFVKVNDLTTFPGLAIRKTKIASIR